MCAASSSLARLAHRLRYSALGMVPIILETAVGWTLSGYLIASTEVFRKLANYGAVGNDRKFLHPFNRIPFQLRFLALFRTQLNLPI
jgi:hypothetical protein